LARECNRPDLGGNPKQVLVLPTDLDGDPVAAGFDLIMAC